MFLSEGLKLAIKIAQGLARENRNGEFTPAHLLKGLLHKDVGLLPMLARLKKDVHYLENWADAKIERNTKTSSLPAIAGNKYITDVIYEANCIRLKLSKDTIAPEYALAAISTPGVGFTCDQMQTFPVKPNELLLPVAENDVIKALLAKDAYPLPALK